MPALIIILLHIEQGSDFATSLVEDINCRKALLRESGILTNPFNLTGE
jgi:hypothetical protein